ncbi:neutral/alkaline non-lysosomal ceramidase N-terminal domain-containing protein [Pontibacter chitinilyticus]|uniref:neutral/alkaline non-lysosomal ceramidase N-terminal domain-containing protein n=1 Tax=Pontibacter chitinilyticus TaxID=2674989 RepID=UPI00321B0E75
MLRSHRYHTILLFYLAGLGLFCQSCVVRPLDEKPFAQSSYYQATLHQLQNTDSGYLEGDTLQVGWAKVNITPPVGTPLAGYGKRRGMRYEQVHDSAWVRTFAFNNGSHTAFLVAVDMLIVPMRVAAQLEQAYPKLGLGPEQVYLTATHSHTSFGGWQKKLAGRLMAGKYNKAVVRQTVEHILQSIRLAQQQLQPTRIGYGQVSVPDLVQNRLTGSRINLDSTLRFIRFEQASGRTAVFCTFAAHPTILPSMQPILSRDYPGALVDALEEQVDFAAFAAGAVGSHQAVYTGDTFASTRQVGQQLAQAVTQQMAATPMAYTATLGYSRVPLLLPDPQWRIGDHKRFAPALFYTFFGRYPAAVNALQLGDMVLLDVPADYSGEFMPLLEAQVARQQQHVLLTGFNGGYVGYLVPEEHYALHKYEVRAMNFYGPLAGNYVTAVLLQLLQQHRPAHQRR